MKHLLPHSLIVAVLLLTPDIALGQEMYAMSDIAYDPFTNTVTAVAHFYPDYGVSYYYTIVKTLQVTANGAMTDNITPQAPPYDTAVVTRAALPYTVYAAYVITQLNTFFYYFYYDPYCDWNPYYCYNNNYYGYYNYFDAFYFSFWGGYCDGFASGLCRGEGPPMWIAIVPIVIEWAVRNYVEVGGIPFSPIQHNYPTNPLGAWPCRITSFFDAYRRNKAHHAQDVVYDDGNGGKSVPPYGTPVQAMNPGTVVKAVSTYGPAPACSPKPNCCSGAFGNYVKIRESDPGYDGYATIYFHVRPAVAEG